MSLKSSMLFRDTSHSTTSSMRPPAARTTSSMFFSVCVVSAPMPPSTSFMVLKSKPCCPLRYSIPRAAVAVEKGNGSFGQPGTFTTFGASSSVAATQRISTTPVPASPPTFTATRLGRPPRRPLPPPNAAAYAAFMASKSSTRARETSQPRTRSRSEPAAFRAALMFASVCVVSGPAPPGTSFRAAMSRPCMPLGYTMPFTFVTMESGTWPMCGQPGTWTTSLWDPDRAAMHLISTREPPASWPTSTQTRLGGSFLKKAAYAPFMAAKSRLISASETLQATTFSRELPAAARSSLRLTRACFVSPSTPPPAFFMVCMSRPPRPLA
mmetsp:Transcript_39348/g.116634  ORF Transcript_39348/g.116634 Transcript_39348/m.116634 type:complete len:325 (-) Transcript_39348:202-1176(-)